MSMEWIEPKKSEDAVVIFVHGILSSSESCWTNKDGTSWSKLVNKTKNLGELSIVEFTYHSKPSGGRYSISDAADALWEDLQHEKLLAESHPLVFVCHSMGGIVVRRMLVKRQTEIPSGFTIGLFLVASPSLGSRWATLLYPLIWLAHHAQARALRLSETNDWLIDLKNDFRLLLKRKTPYIVGRELIEEKSIILGWIPWVPPVVRRIESDVFFADSLVIEESDHFSIAKPAGTSANQHTALCRFILETVKNSCQHNFNVPQGWTFRDAVMSLAEKENMYVEFKGFSEHELNTETGISAQIVGKDIFEVIQHLPNAYADGSLSRFTVQKRSSTLVLSVVQ